MGRIGKLLSFVRTSRGNSAVSDVKVDRGGGDNRTLQHFSAPGDDSYPLPGDYVATVGQAGTGRDSATGYVDPKNDQKASQGDKRIYARDASGNMVVEVWLQNDGTAIVQNDEGVITLTPGGSISGTNSNGSFDLQAGGDFVVNGVTIAANGDVDIPNSLILDGRELSDHNHNITSGSSSPGPTGPNN